MEGLHIDPPVPEQKKLAEILLDKDLTSETLKKIGRGSYEEAPESAKLIWNFLGRKVYPKISKEFKNMVENKRLEVDGELVKEKAKVSDEALCLQILDVKIEEFAKWVERKEERRKEQEQRKRAREEQNGRMDNVNEETARGRRAKRIKKSQVTKRDGKKSELKDRIEDYNSYYKQLEDLRAGKTDPTEGSSAATVDHTGWHESLAQNIMEQRTGESPTHEAIAANADADDADNSSRGGSQVIAMDEEELNRFIAV